MRRTTRGMELLLTPGDCLPLFVRRLLVGRFMLPPDIILPAVTAVNVMTTTTSLLLRPVLQCFYLPVDLHAAVVFSLHGGASAVSRCLTWQVLPSPSLLALLRGTGVTLCWAGPSAVT